MIEHDNITDYKTNVESTFQPDSRRTPPSVEE